MIVCSQLSLLAILLFCSWLMYLRGIHLDSYIQRLNIGNDRIFLARDFLWRNNLSQRKCSAIQKWRFLTGILYYDFFSPAHSALISCQRLFSFQMILFLFEFMLLSSATEDKLLRNYKSLE